MPHEGWRERDAMKFITAIGKQLLDLCGADAARSRVGRVEPEVVLQDHATGTSNSQHLTRHVALDFVIQNGGEDRELHGQVEAVRGVRQVLPFHQFLDSVTINSGLLTLGSFAWL